MRQLEFKEVAIHLLDGWEDRVELFRNGSSVTLHPLPFHSLTSVELKNLIKDFVVYIESDGEETYIKCVGKLGGKDEHTYSH